MFKVVSAEIKKMLAKPGIYVLAILLAAILILGVFIYNPSEIKSSEFTLKGGTVLERKVDFTQNDSTTAGYKADADNKLANAIANVNKYYVSLEVGKSRKDQIDELLEDFNTAYKEYKQLSSQSSGVVNDNIINGIYRNSVVNKFRALDNQIRENIDLSRSGAYITLTTESNYEAYKSAFTKALAFLDQDVKKTDPDESKTLAGHCKEFEEKYRPSFDKAMNEFIYPTISVKEANDLTSEGKTKYSQFLTKLNAIKDKIDEVTANAQADNNYNIKNADLMTELANEYVAISTTYEKLIEYTLITNAFNGLSVKTQQQLLYLNNESNYNNNSLLIRYNYLFENDKTVATYANPLTIGTTSNSTKNAYDYAYFTLRLFSFVIIVYAVLQACHTIAGEIKEGSMRYYAIRPVTRSNIYFGKLLAILLLSIIMIIFTSIIALAVGGAVYGFKTLNILTIFNGKYAMVLHPIAMLGIFIFSWILELLIYLSIGLLLSTLLKSDLLSVTIVMLLYLINILLPVFFRGSNTWLAYYPFSYISFYSLFGSSVFANVEDVMNMILGAKVYAATNVYLVTGIIIAIIILVNFFAVRRFKTKEL